MLVGKTARSVCKAALTAQQAGSNDIISVTQVGQRVFAIGFPFALDQSLTAGIVSGLGREMQSITGALLTHAFAALICPPVSFVPRLITLLSLACGAQ